MSQHNDSGVPLASPIDIRSTSLVILAVLAVIYFLDWAQAVFAPLVLAVLFSYALCPVVSALTRVYIPRVLGAAIVVLALVGVVVYAGMSLQDQMLVMLDKVPEALKEFNRLRHFADLGDTSVIDKVAEAAIEIEKVTEATNLSPEDVVQPGLERVVVQEKKLDLRGYILGG